MGPTLVFLVPQSPHPSNGLLTLLSLRTAGRGAWTHAPSVLSMEEGSVTGIPRKSIPFRLTTAHGLSREGRERVQGEQATPAWPQHMGQRPVAAPLSAPLFALEYPLPCVGLPSPGARPCSWSSSKSLSANSTLIASWPSFK